MSLYVEEASKDVELAEGDILAALRKKREGTSPSDLITELMKKRRQLSEDEIRQAIWRLLAVGDVELSPDLKLTSGTD